jgi:FixJ family two-component response regulator
MTSIVHIVDDDASCRKATARLLSAHGLEVKTYKSGDEFLDCLSTCEPGCVLLDLQMPGQSGLQVQRELCERAPLLPVVFLTGEGDIGVSVEAMKAGAHDFLEKRNSAPLLMNAIKRALAHSETRQEEHGRRQEQRRLVASMTAREAEVFKLLVRGHLNKQIAYALGISERTVKVHRHRVMEKLGVRSVVEVASIAASAGQFEGKSGVVTSL